MAATGRPHGGGDGVADEAQSVLAWFEFYTRLYENDDGVARPSRTLITLLQSAFPALYGDIAARRMLFGMEEWACVVILLEAFYEVELKLDRSMLKDAMTFEDASAHVACVSILEFVVCALVQSDDKARFVRDIMTMEDSVQVDIMAVIERVMATTAALVSANQSVSGDAFSPRKQSDVRSISETTSHETHNGHHYGGYEASPARSASQHEAESPCSTTSRSPLHLSRNADMERLHRANEILKDENAHIMEELSAVTLKFERAESENSTLLQTIQELKTQSEMDILKKERTVRCFFDERMHAMQRDLDRAVAELEEKRVISKDVYELRDEIDLLRPSAERLAKAEATLAKYKTKIEELTSAKEKLRRIEEANAELVEKNLALENQAAKTAALQRKLADSKETNTTIQFRVSELESLLARVSSEFEAKRAECDSSASALTEARALNAQLQQTVDQQAESMGIFQPMSSGSASSISELSPELMEKLARLEHDNKTLRSQVDGTTSERIDSLVDELEDANRMKKSFEAKYFETNEALKETTATLKTTETGLAALQFEHATLVRDLDVMTTDRDGQRENFAAAKEEIRRLIDTNNESQAAIQRHIAAQERLEAELACCQHEISSLQLTLRQTTQELHLSNERNDHLLEDVEAHQIEKQEAVFLREELRTNVRALEDDVAAKANHIAKLEGTHTILQNQMSEALAQIACLQESDTQHALRCEELDASLLLKLESIANQETQISQLSELTVQLKRGIDNLKLVESNAHQHIQLLTEQLHMTSADLAVVQDKRLCLKGDVTNLQRDIANLDELLNKAKETLEMTENDYQHKMFLAEEDKAKELGALVKQHAAELEKMSAEKADIVTRMTGSLDENFIAIQAMKNEMEDLCVIHSRDLEALRGHLEHEKKILTDEVKKVAAEFEEYTATHSFSNEDIVSKETAHQSHFKEMATRLQDEMSTLSQQCDSLKEQVKRLTETNRDMKMNFEGQEVKLKEALRAQLDANQKLIEANQGLKTQLSKSMARVQQLEKAVTRLDSRILVHERERAHISSEEGRKRDPDESASDGAELSTHVKQVMEDYDQLRQENQRLHEQLAQRHSDLIDDGDAENPNSMKAYLTERIRQLDLARSQEESKKREILLVNAKLSQEQKQLHVKHAGDARELQSLKEKVNSWMLRDERRKKEYEVFTQRFQALEAENKKLRMNTKPRVVAALKEELSPLSSEESLEPIVPLQSASSDDQENIPPPTETTLLSPVRSTARKRKLDEAEVDEKEPGHELASQDGEVVSSAEKRPRNQDIDVEKLADPATPTAAPRAKRRMSLFISNRLTTASTTTSPKEKPSECHQQ